MSDAAPAMLAYGTIDTQFGVVCEDRADGGITVTIPTTTWAYVRRRTPPSHPIVILFTIGWYFVEKLRNRPLPPRAVIELTAEAFTITEPGGEAVPGGPSRTWRLDEVGEVRPNRYGKGLYIRIPGKDNFDMLGDLDQRLVQHVGDRIFTALGRLRLQCASNDVSR